MKRALLLILVFSLLLSGCSFFGQRIKEPVTFYYLCSQYQEELCCVIASEQREASGHTGDLPYLLALYSMGPADEEMVSPLPVRAQITSTQEESHVFLEWENSGFPLSDVDFSLACACLTLTCLGITEAQTVTIRCGDREKTLSRDSLTLSDIIAETLPMEDLQ